MQVKCNTNIGELHARREVEKGNSRQTEHERLTVGATYEVYAIVYWDDRFLYLLRDDCRFPVWYEASMFEVIDARIPPDWKYTFNGYIDYGVSALWGYDELVDNPDHYDGLAQGDSKDIEKFDAKFPS